MMASPEFSNRYKHFGFIRQLSLLIITFNNRQGKAFLKV